MIEQRRLPKGWNRHHTLYYRRNYESMRDTRQWREHPSMIVPMEIGRHNLMHTKTPPVDQMPSWELTRFALEWCFLLDQDTSLITPLEGFTSMRDELTRHFRYNRGSRIGKEALKFSDQFTQQIQFMEPM